MLVMKGIPPALLVLVPFLPLAAGELPQLTVKPWIGSYSGYEHRSFHFVVGNDGECLLTPMGGKKTLMSGRLGIRIQPVVEDVLTDGRVVAKRPANDGWEAVTPAAADPEKVGYRGTVAGGARFEVMIEFDGDQIRAGGRLLAKGKLENPRFVLRIQVPDVYYSDSKIESRKIKAKRDRVDLLRMDGKKLKLDLLTPLDAESEEFSGPGVAEARLDLAGYRGHRFHFDAGDGAAFEIWNKGELALIEGFHLAWKPDPAKDPDGKARMILRVR